MSALHETWRRWTLSKEVPGGARLLLHWNGQAYYICMAVRSLIDLLLEG